MLPCKTDDMFARDGHCDNSLPSFLDLKIVLDPHGKIINRCVQENNSDMILSVLFLVFLQT